MSGVRTGSAWVLPQQRRQGPRTPLQHLGTTLRGLCPDDPGRYSVTDLSGRFAGAAERGGSGDLRGDLRARDASSAPFGQWIPIRDVLEPMLAADGPHLTVSPAVTAARLIGSIGYAVAGRPAVAMAVTGQAYDTGPGSLLVTLDEEGLINEIGVTGTELAHGSVHSVATWIAGRAHATLAPLIDELHERTRFGTRPMWNLVADTVLGPATTAGYLAGLGMAGQRAGFAAGSELIDALNAQGATIARRGTLCTDSSAGDRLGPGPLDTDFPDAGPGLTVRRGSCCLYYRQPAEEKCSTCPLTPPRR